MLTSRWLFLQLIALCVVAPTWAAPLSPARQVHEEVSPLRERHSAVIWGDKTATVEQLHAILADLDKGLTQLATPLHRGLAEGDPSLRFRRYHFLNDKAKLQARLGDRAGALATLGDMSRMAWLAPSGSGPEGDPDLKPLLEHPAAVGLRARYAVGPRFGPVSALKTAYRGQLSAAERLAGLSRIWSAARQGFVWFDLVPDLDWDKAYLETIPRVLAARDTKAYYRELIRFTALLKDGHSSVSPPKSLEDHFYAWPGLTVARIEGQVLVTKVRDAALARQGLRAGDVVLSIDGLAVDAYAARYVTPLQSSSTPQDLELRSYSYMLLAGDAKRAVRLGLRRVDGRRYAVLARRSGYTQAPANASVAFELRADGVAVLRAGQFGNDDAAKLLEANIDAVLQAKAFVIDLRDNDGGSSDYGWMLLSWLQRGPIPTPVSQVREDSAYQQARLGPSAAPLWRDLPQEPFEMARPKHFDGPVAVLINAATFSAAEDMAAAFKLMKRGLIVGVPSGGSTGQPLSIALPGGGSARICVKRDSYPDGSDFVGVGVQPDLVVAQTVASVRAGADPVLQRAAQALLAPKP
ncbi:S41 family peptidase [Rhodoferax sp.]|uniref:S41 family peptidase n=1 Tax=Rhodoferax sp. TaxID=50421 RepID=UPI00275CB459|nr:S41 family peptidase [Rhodoferax sp.]